MPPISRREKELVLLPKMDSYWHFGYRIWKEEKSCCLSLHHTQLIDKQQQNVNRDDVFLPSWPLLSFHVFLFPGKLLSNPR